VERRVLHLKIRWLIPPMVLQEYVLLSAMQHPNAEGNEKRLQRD